jgi:hypothetical protein
MMNDSLSFRYFWKSYYTIGCLVVISFSSTPSLFLYGYARNRTEHIYFDQKIYPVLILTRNSTLCSFWREILPCSPFDIVLISMSSKLSLFLRLRKKQIRPHLFWSENLPVLLLNRKCTMCSFWHSFDLHLLLLTCWLNTKLDNPVMSAEIFLRQAMVVGGQLSSTIYLQFFVAMIVLCWQNNSCKVFGHRSSWVVVLLPSVHLLRYKTMWFDFCLFSCQPFSYLCALRTCCSTTTLGSSTVKIS